MASFVSFLVSFMGETLPMCIFSIREDNTAQVFGTTGDTWV